VIENLGLATLRLGDERLVQDVEDILADFLQLGLNLLAVVADDGDMLVGAFGFLLLFDGGNDAPRGTSGSYDVLVCDRKQVTLIDGQFTI
jgi:hypothetical protein